MVPGRKSLPLLTMLLLILGASIYITGLVMRGGDGEGQFLYPQGSDAELLPVIPTRGEVPTESLAIEVSFEIRPVARIFSVRSRRDLPLSLSHGEKPFPASFRSVAGSWCRASVARGGQNLVRIQPQHGTEIYRLIDLPGPGEGIIDVSLWGPAVLHGRVLDADGEPLAGAAVWGGLGDPGQVSSWVNCEADGSFELRLPVSGRGLPLVARAEGFASSFRALWVDGVVREGIEIYLQAATSLLVQLAAILEDPASGRLFLRPAIGETRLREYPFFVHAMGWSFDERGRCRISDLPADANLELVLNHPQVILPGARSLRLGRKPEHFVLQAPKSAMIRGRVLDAQGRPLPGATLHSFEAGRGVPAGRRAALLPAGAMAHGEATASSDSSGAFRIAYIPSSAKDRLIRVSAPGYWGMELQLAAGHTDLRRNFVLEPITESAGEPELHFLLATPGRRVIKQVGRSWHAWPEGEAFVRPFREPALVDVLVRIRFRSKDVEREQLFTRVLVNGSVDLDIK